MGSLPTLPENARAAIELFASDKVDLIDVVNLVVADFSLTNEVLRLANSTQFASGRGHISSISEALAIIGYNTVGHLVLKLNLIDAMAASLDVTAARQELAKVSLAGALARAMARESGIASEEEASLATFLRDTGRMLVVMYLPEDWKQISTLLQQGVSELSASSNILNGLSFEEIGRQAAKRWHIPTSGGASSGKEAIKSAWLRAVADASSSAVSQLDTKGLDPTFQAVAHEYADALGFNKETLVHVLHAGLNQARKPDKPDLSPSSSLDLTLDLTKGLVSPPQTASVKKHTPVGGSEIEPYCNPLVNSPDSLNTLDYCKLSEAGTIAQLIHAVADAFHNISKCHRAYASLLNLDTQEYVIGASAGDHPSPNFQTSLNTKSLGTAGGLANLLFEKKKLIHLTSPKSVTLRWDIPLWLKNEVADSGTLLLMPISVAKCPAIILVGEWNTGPGPSTFETANIARMKELGAKVTNAFENIVSAEAMATSLAGNWGRKVLEGIPRLESQWAARLYPNLN